MTERISHEEARLAVFETRPANTELLQAYITQQQALEADTVSRAEHEAALARVREAWAKESAAEKNAHRVVEDDLEAKLTALQAELATERARAEEAERLERVARGVLKRQADELAAANARAGRLKELAKELWNEGNERNGPRDYCSIAERIRSALRGGGSHPPEQSEGQDLGTAAREVTALSTAPQASTEQASPSPAVGNPHSGSSFESAFTAEELMEIQPAQPAPGGTGRCLHGPLTASGSRVRVNLPESDNHGAVGNIAERGKDANFEWRVRFDETARNDGDVWFRTEHLELADHTPAEPQGRPEQAGEYVTRSELVEAPRSVNYTPFADVAERLEGK